MERSVLMEVPLSLAARVADLLDEHEFTAKGQPVGGGDAERVFVPQEGPWAEEEVAALAGRVVERNYELVLDLLDLAASQPGLWVSPPTQRATSPHHVRNQLVALSKLIKKDFDGRSYWPMETKRAEDSAYYYRFSAEVAAWWVAARKAQA